MQTFVDRFKANAKLTTLAQSRMKAIAKMQVGMTAEVMQDPDVIFNFPNYLKKIPTPCMRLQEAKIGYPGCEPILAKVDFDVDLDTRIALIGPNGAGKSTIIKALLGDIELFDGSRIFHNRLKVGVFNQHHADTYDLKKTALDLMIEKWPDHKPIQDFRSHLGSFGLAGNL
jgi:ATP-binding cassette subfamily F protein 3